MKSLLARCALLVALGSPAAVMAQGGGVLPPADIYQELVGTLYPPESDEPLIRRMIDADLPAQWRTDPGFTEMESRCPGVISAMA